jgi:protein phosphatase
MTATQSNDVFAWTTHKTAAMCMLLGKKRKRQEDAAYLSDNLVIVADGMGGQADGDKASLAAVDTIEKYLTAPPDSLFDDDDYAGLVAGAFMAANDSVAEMSMGRGMRSPATTALVGWRTGEHEMVLGHIGDSRIYSYCKGELTQLTTDHEAWNGSILRYIGWGGGGYPDTFAVSMPEGGRLIFATDGLFGMIPDERIGLLCKSNETGTVLDLAQALAHDADDAGGHDNVTVVVVEL